MYLAKQKNGIIGICLGRVKEMNQYYWNELKQSGFAQFDLRAELPTIKESELEVLKQAFASMPPDAYAQTKGRYRRFSRAVIMPWNLHVEWLPSMHDEDGNEVAEYFQGDFNPEYKEAYRSFPALPGEVRATELLKNIIQYDFAQTNWQERDEKMPINVGVHFVRLIVEKDGEEAVSSPNCLHRDGEPFTFAHLIQRLNVDGGHNVIATIGDTDQLPEAIDSSHIKASFELTEALSSYGVADALVSHYVSGVKKGAAAGPAIRDIILIDYQPTVVKAL